MTLKLFQPPFEHGQGLNQETLVGHLAFGPELVRLVRQLFESCALASAGFLPRLLSDL